MSELFFGLGLMTGAVITLGLIGGFRFAAWEGDLHNLKLVPDSCKAVALLCFHTGALIAYPTIMAQVSVEFFIFFTILGGAAIVLFVGLVSAPFFERFRKMKKWYDENFAAD